MPLARAIGRAIIRKYAGTGLSSSAMVRLLERNKATYHNQTMLRDIRIEEGRAIHHLQLRDMPHNNVVPEAWIVPRQFTTGEEYRVLGEMTYYDYDTGQVNTKLASFFTNDYAEMDDYDREFMARAGEYKYEDNIEILGFRTSGLERNTPGA